MRELLSARRLSSFLTIAVQIPLHLYRADAESLVSRGNRCAVRTLEELQSRVHSCARDEVLFKTKVQDTDSDGLLGRVGGAGESAGEPGTD
jgi:hypothetical protein